MTTLVEEQGYRFDQHPMIAGEDGSVGDYFLAFDIIDHSGSLQTTFRSLSINLQARAHRTMLKMLGTSEVFYPKSLELHVGRENKQDMDLEQFQTLLGELLSDQERERLNVTLRRDRAWCVIALNSNF